MNGIPDAPWIRYADTNGVPPYECDNEESYIAVVEELDGSTTTESFNDYDSAADYFKSCIEEGVISVIIKRCYGDANGELLDYYDNDEEDE